MTSPDLNEMLGASPTPVLISAEQFPISNLAPTPVSGPIAEIASTPNNEPFSELEWQEIESHAKEFGALVGGSIEKLKIRGPVIATTVWHNSYRSEWIIAESAELTSLIQRVKTTLEAEPDSNHEPVLPLKVKVARHAGSLVLTPLGLITAGAIEIYPAIATGNGTMLGVGLGIVGVSTVAGAITDRRRRRTRLEEYAGRFNRLISVEGIQSNQNSTFVMKYVTEGRNKIIESSDGTIIEAGSALDYSYGWRKGIAAKTDPSRAKSKYLSVDFTDWFDKSVFKDPAPTDNAVFIDSWNGILGETVKSIQPIMEQLESTEKSLRLTDYSKRLERNLLQEKIEMLSNEIAGIVVDYETSRRRVEGIRSVKKTAETITRTIIELDEQARAYSDGTNTFTRGIAYVTALVARTFWMAKPHPIADRYAYTQAIKALFKQADEALLLVKDPKDDSDHERIYDPDTVVRQFHKTIMDCINDNPNAMIKRPAIARKLKDFTKFYAMYFDEGDAAYKISPNPEFEGKWLVLPAQNKK